MSPTKRRRQHLTQGATKKADCAQQDMAVIARAGVTPLTPKAIA